MKPLDSSEVLEQMYNKKKQATICVSFSMKMIFHFLFPLSNILGLGLIFKTSVFMLCVTVAVTRRWRLQTHKRALVRVSWKSRVFTVLSVQEDLVMCLASFLGLERGLWAPRVVVSPHQQQSRWGPSPQAKPSHQPHLSHSPPCLASCSEHSHNNKRDAGKTAGCSARGWGKNCKTLHQNLL